MNAAATYESLGPHAPLPSPPGRGAPFEPPPPSTLVGAGVSEVDVGVVEVWFELLVELEAVELEDVEFPEGPGGVLVRVTVVRTVATAVVV